MFLAISGAGEGGGGCTDAMFVCSLMTIDPPIPTSHPNFHRLSAGADVNDYLLGLGAQKGKTPTNGGLKILSLGQGQGPIAERLMVTGRCAHT